MRCAGVSHQTNSIVFFLNDLPKTETLGKSLWFYIRWTENYPIKNKFTFSFITGGKGNMNYPIRKHVAYDDYVLEPLYGDIATLN